MLDVSSNRYSSCYLCFSFVTGLFCGTFPVSQALCLSFALSSKMNASNVISSVIKYSNSMWRWIDQEKKKHVEMGKILT